MNKKDKFKIRLLGSTGSIQRFLLTAFFLLAASVVIAIAIHSKGDIYEKLVITFVLGALLGMTAQILYERFFMNGIYRILLNTAAIIFAGIYFLIINSISEMDTDFMLRTSVIMFILVIAFLWIPSIKSRISFNESFMAVFKAFFIAVFFTGVLFLGICLILAATNALIISVDERLYQHSANIIFVLLAPMYFLSLIPVYPAEAVKKAVPEINSLPDNGQEQLSSEPVSDEDINKPEDFLQKATGAAKFLETLISYVIIPVTAVFTVILLLYIIINITGSFWTDNLLEPMLVSYSIVVIIIYLLASRLDNVFAKSFRKVFPKVLIPIVLFQTISSILRIKEVGVTYGRYYVIMFGVFATVSGIIFCILPIRKNGVIAPLLIGLSLISIIPPVDAFTVSRMNQTRRLENVLKRNNMLNGTKIIPNQSLPEKEQKIIVSSIEYLDSMHYTDNIEWLYQNLHNSSFDKTFGFPEYGQIDKGYQNSHFYRQLGPIPVAGYDFMVRTGINQNNAMEVSKLMKNGITYILSVEYSPDHWDIVLKNDKNKDILRYPVQEIFSPFENRNGDNTALTTEEATLTKENDLAAITVIIENIDMSIYQGEKTQSAELYLLIKLK